MASSPFETDDVFDEVGESLTLQFFDKDEDNVLVESLDVCSNFTLEGFSIDEQDVFENLFPDAVDLQFEESNDASNPSSSTSESIQIGESVNISEDVFDSTKVTEPPKRRRGRRPKSEASLGPLLPKERRPKKNKLYEISQPFKDETLEKKRQNAIQAKVHRDTAKHQMELLQKEVEITKKEKEVLVRESERLKANIEKLRESLKIYKERTLSISSEL
ncbi:uncharacterized protein [Palaemon carinicauda]|uniref:uncharacterized protein n=1 Tax=Palaemon carinicauda TaxID=392227 RepID=UPI0035B64DA0